MKLSIRNCAFRWQISKSIKDIAHFGAIFHHFKIVYLKFVDDNIHNDAIRRRISIQVTAPIFTLYLPIFQTLKMWVKITEYSMCNDGIQWQVSKKGIIK